MISLRWRKVLRDVLSYKTRTFLVILSIAVGVTALGMVVATEVTITTDLPGSYAAINPALAILGLSGFDDELVKTVRKMPGVADAEGGRRVSATVQVGENESKEVRLTAFRHFDKQQLNKVWYESGKWPPEKGEVLIERASLALLNAKVGDTITIRLNDEFTRDLKIVGLTHDLNEISASLTNRIFGYIDFDTLEWLDVPTTYDRLYLRTSEGQTDRNHIQAVAEDIGQRLERAGYQLYWTQVPEPGKHEFEQFLGPMTIILGSLGILSLLLSAFLVTNLISAILAQQTRQIGVMKAIGGQRGQIAGLYLATVLIFSLLAMAVAIPLSLLGANWLTRFIADLMNFNILSSLLSPQVLALELFAGVVIPQCAALWPILRGTRITVREAISDYGVSSADGQGGIEWLLSRIHFLSRPQLLSLRNTFRRKGRLILTVTTLTLASAIFISVFSVRASMLETLDEALSYWKYDLRLSLDRRYRVDLLESKAMAIPGVTAAEGWILWNTFRYRPDGTQSDSVLFVAPPPNSQLIQPILLDGRWLLPEDENAVVINTDLLNNDADVKVGDTLVLDINDKKTDWQVVGLVRGVMSGAYIYVNFPYLAEKIGSVGQTSTLHVAFDRSDEVSVRQYAEQLRANFEAKGIRVNNLNFTSERRRVVTGQFDILIEVLTVMAVLLAVVGGLGLMGTMSINVLERRREIGVMRAIGASNGIVIRVVLLEGIVIGLLSWIIGTIVALPLGKVMSDAIGAGFIHSDLTFVFSTNGALGWLAILLIIAASASFVPARSAAKLTVREVLAYE
ncbi:MAG: FtsX-like permease family protein [Caldilineaceae bacterium]